MKLSAPQRALLLDMAANPERPLTLYTLRDGRRAERCQPAQGEAMVQPKMLD
jgi:hypothetical protein